MAKNGNCQDPSGRSLGFFFFGSMFIALRFLILCYDYKTSMITISDVIFNSKVLECNWGKIEIWKRDRRDTNTQVRA